MCKANCPVFSVKKTEIDSPRGKAILKKHKKEDTVFYECTLCGACHVLCASDVELDSEIRKEREKLAEKGKVPESVKKMIKNVREHGNPYGKVEKGKLPKDLYCC